ncbi:MAG: dephospho-CoA kinase [Enterobacteriaceae bacterium]
MTPAEYKISSQKDASGSEKQSTDFICHPFVVALTGGIGSGKSTVAAAFAQLNVPVIDADVIARQVVAPGQPALASISQHFGAEVLLPDGQLNRAYVKKRIFGHPEERLWLNKLLHPLIRQETLQQIAQIKQPYVLWVVPLLIENQLQQQADRILVVDVSREVQIARTSARDAADRQQTEQILAAQVSRQERLSYADDIIDNNGSPQQIIPQVASLHQRYLTMASTQRTVGLKQNV